ncbi:hypothetical protein F5J12DRAFT_721183 [Pisolithus orientalis]|uniref:uncharacterized protein n=1 Tax=Pisolithus orientalis TaxID=936130 RepID=UPI002225206D|nr:uncharacterized protein F5J12DRAFT_721183 [Pisolithus orientalis]KAI6006178.1 hypothetical protein F5J12DRAFT_721183 [Pisolithus orientalis]
MPSIVNLKFKGNKSFVAFSNLSDSESLTKTWKVCTKVASYLEQGQRLENLSWRLWHLQSLIVDTDNARSKREFKKLSKNMGDKLDREKGRSIEELEAPDFKRNASTDLICQRAAERERSREANQNAIPGTIKRMQFTFSVDQPSPAAPNNVLSKPDLKPCPEFKDSHTSAARRGRQATRSSNHNSVAGDDSNNDQDSSPPAMASRKRKHSSSAVHVLQQPTLKFPSLFSNDFGPSALLSAIPTLTTPMNYGEDVTRSSSTSHHALSIFRPTIELPLDELLDSCNEETPSASSALDAINTPGDSDIVMQDLPGATSTSNASATSTPNANTGPANPSISSSTPATVTNPNVGTSVHLTTQTNPSAGMTHTKPSPSTGTRGRPSLTVKTSSHLTRSSTGPSATASGVAVNTPGGGNVNTNGAHGGTHGSIKAECSNCGATHTPLWRRGLNDELNCNACGLYCKLHKRPRPKTMRSNHAERHPTTSTSHTSTHTSIHASTSSNVHAGTNGTAQCYNCHTTATPLWRKDDEGKTVCNACGLYYKLHGSARPISMKSDVIRKRSRHDASSGSGTTSASASPGPSCRASPNVDTLDVSESPTLAPDSTTQPAAYEFGEDGVVNVGVHGVGVHGVGAAGTSVLGHAYAGIFGHHAYPGPYHPDYLSSQFHLDAALPFSGVDGMDGEESPGAAATGGDEHRSSKRRRMSTDSASEPPSSAVSYSSYAESMMSTSTAPTSAISASHHPLASHHAFSSHSRRSSMDFPFFTPYGVFRGSVSNTFWHPPMVIAEPDRSPQPAGFHPPMLLPEEENLFATYFHPPMLLPSEDGDVQQDGGDTTGSSATSHSENQQHQRRMDDGSQRDRQE